jgi:arylsulfatase A-like enzyme
MNSSRRRFIQFSALSAAQTRREEACKPSFLDRRSGAHAYCATAGAAKPNVFLISVDMISPDHWRPGRAALDAMNLPALRGLFGDSVFFSNAFTTNPLCAPARAALLTGRSTYILANNERAHDGHETSLRASDSIFPEYLKAAGYDTRHCGKGHLGAQKFFDGFGENADGWDRWDPPVRSDESYIAHLRQLGVRPQRYRKEIRGLQQDRRTPANSFGGWIEQEDGADFPVEAQYSHYLAARAVKKLDSALQSKKPVYLQLDFFDPHQPFSIPAGFEQRERELRAAFQLPASYLAARERDFRPDPALPRVYDLYRKYWGLYDSRTAADYRVANALQVEVIDRALALFLGELKRRGLYDEALILFTSDHGEMNGRRALVDKGVYLHPEVLRVPLAIKPPKSAGIAPRIEETPVSHLDISPTMLELAGVQPAERQDGVSLLPLLNGKPHAPKPYIAECGWHVGTNFACAMHDGRHLYSYNLASDKPELYDLNDEDPRNLAALPEHSRTRAALAERLGAFLESDPRWQCYWSSFRLDHYDILPRPKGDLQLQKAD